MRAVVQRVNEAQVCVEDGGCSAIGRGLLILLGVAENDSEADCDYIVDKVANLRIFPDGGGKMNRSVVDVGGSVLVVSQFTLMGDVRRGRRPDFFAAASPERAEQLYESVILALRGRSVEVKKGFFGAHMHVDLINDGPVTILLDSQKSF